MKYACIYCIVRFTPFADTDELANVGIILTAPAISRMEYKLANESLEMAKNEPDAVRAITSTAQEDQIVNHFRFLTEHKESLIRFSAMRSILMNDFGTTLEGLFAR